MNRKLIILAVLAAALIGYGFSSRQNVLYYAATDFPPWDINEAGRPASGINADVIRAVAESLGLTFQPVRCPWKRCLMLLEEGTIDMAGTVKRTEERERFLHFIEPTYAPVPDQVFYLRVESDALINRYEDLYLFDKIGLERGAKVSPRFDQDDELKRFEAAKLEQLLYMLKRGRLQVIVGNEVVMDYLIGKMAMRGIFKKASFRFVSEDWEYLAISKSSPHMKRMAEISQAVQTLKDSGKIDAFIKTYSER